MTTEMKTLEATLLFFVAIATVGCRQQPQSKRAQMMLDSAASGRNVTIVRPKEAVRPVESLTDTKELSTGMQSDSDALHRAPSKEVRYVRPGESVRPSENTR